MTLGQRVAAHFVAPAGERDAAPAASPRPRRRPRAAMDRATRTRWSADRAARRRPPVTDRFTGSERSDTDRAAPTSSAVVPAPPAVAVLAPSADAPALGAALGLALARATRAPACVVCVWSPEQTRASRRAPALPAAARVAATLRERGHDATAAGRLAVVRLATDAEEAASQALRAAAAAGPAPTVLALAGPRAAAFDDLLAMQDLVVVAVAPAADDSLARLASAGLERALTCAVPPADPGRALAAAGLVLLPSTRRALAAPVAALS